MATKAKVKKKQKKKTRRSLIFVTFLLPHSAVNLQISLIKYRRDCRDERLPLLGITILNLGENKAIARVGYAESMKDFQNAIAGLRAEMRTTAKS